MQQDGHQAEDQHQRAVQLPRHLLQRKHSSSPGAHLERAGLTARGAGFTWGKVIMRTGIMDSSSLAWGKASLVWEQEVADRTQEVEFSPAAHLGRLHVEVRPEDVDVGVEVEGSGRLPLPRLPHLKETEGGGGAYSILPSP